MKQLSIMVALAALLGVSACTWVKPTADAANVHVVGEENLHGCTYLGKVIVKVRDELLFDVKRDPQKVQTELETLARNNAASELQGDSIIANGQIEDGKQKFDVYKCRQ